jgi:hypothetical protein
VELNAIDSGSFLGVRVPRSIVGDENEGGVFDIERFEASETLVCEGRDFAFELTAVRAARLGRALFLLGAYWIVRNQSRNSSAAIKRG